MCRIGLLVAIAACITFGADGQSSDAPVLWQIGDGDSLTGDLAFGPAGYSELRDDACYVVGWSDAAHEWPYVQPGPQDTWAGERPHTYTVEFFLATLPTEGTCTLEVYLANTHYIGPPKLRIALNGKAQTLSMPVGGGGDATLQGHPEQGTPHAFTVEWPASVLKAGQNTLRIHTVEGSWMLYDRLAFRAPEGATLDTTREPTPIVGDAKAIPVLYDQGGVLVQPVRVAARAFGAISQVTLVAGEQRTPVDVAGGMQELEVTVPAVDTPTTLTVALEHDGQVIAEREVTLAPVRKWTLYLLHHTHLDIGYTHHQSEVEHIQWQHIDRALELIEETKDYPEAARFTWLPEGLWAVDSYLQQATPAQQTAFFGAVRAGSIGLDALYGNQLTALCRPEELIELTGCARRLAAAHDLTIDSAMITDVPGYTWGIVPVLAKSGVKYFSVGPNRGHRIGFTLTQWGDKPFYWVSPSGKERVLTWIHGEGYSWFHGGVSAAPAYRAQYEEKILGYLNALQQREDYPYDIAMLRYNIGGDNGPPDEYLPDFIRQWNEKYAYPKLSFATTGGAFAEFEASYGDRLPEVRGDFTPYWEDGAGSSARETALARAAAERLVQAGAVSAMTGAPYDTAAFEKAWREVILYDEHTWGAHNSISEPQSAFALQQWATKQEFALEAEAQSATLLETSLSPVRTASGPAPNVGLFNTESWPRTQLVVLPDSWNDAGNCVMAKGERLRSQRLASGALAVLAEQAPALGVLSLQLSKDAPRTEGDAHAEGSTLTNGIVTVSIDAATGAITELRLADGPNLAGDDGFGGLNAYRYVAGRVPDHPEPSGAATLEIVEQGPVLAMLRVTSAAPGCEQLVRDITVVHGSPEVFITDTLDKTAIYEPEGVHIAFPFHVPGGTVRMDTPFAVVRPETDQLKGACKNYFTVQRWVDISNDDYGVTWATLDAPLIEIGGITNDARATEWIAELTPSTTILSYVMNNYWETNYKAAQDGPTVFRYVLRPHAGYDEAAAQRFGTAVSRPLIAVALNRPLETTEGLAPTKDGLVIQALRPNGDNTFLVRLFNAGDSPRNIHEACPALAGANPRLATLDGEPRAPLSDDAALAPHDFMTIVCDASLWTAAR